MTFEERMAAIDRYFDSISSDEFNELLETKYGIPRNEDDSINEGDEFPEYSNLTVECSVCLSYKKNMEIDSTSSEDYAKAA